MMCLPMKEDTRKVKGTSGLLKSPVSDSLLKTYSFCFELVISVPLTVPSVLFCLLCRITFTALP